MIAAIVQLALYFALVAGLQYAGNAFRDDFSGASDEPSHYVTGLMVRDYLAAGLPREPMRFAENFYLHYPKMAFGHWPPVAYGMLAVWMLIFGAGRTSVLLLLALVSAGCALLLYQAARRVLSPVSANLIAAALLLLPVVQQHYDMVMLEMPLMLLSFAAALSFGRLLARDNWMNAVWSSVFATAAIMTKGNAWALALMPPIALLLLRDLKRILNPRIILGTVIVAAGAVPFMLWSRRMVASSWEIKSFDWRFTMMASVSMGQFLFQIVGLVLAVCVVAGITVRVLIPLWRKSVESFWAVMLAYVLCVWIFQFLVPVGIEPRYVLAATPAMLLFAGAGMDWFVQALPERFPLRRRRIAIAAIVSVVFLAMTFTIPRSYCPGFVRASNFLLSKPEFKDVGFLISSSTDGEGRFIAEVASREVWPHHVLIRSTKALSRTNWNNTDYHLRCSTPAEVSGVLNWFGVAVVVLDTRPGQSAFLHHDLLRTTLNADPDWQKIYSDRLRCTRHPEGEEIVMYSYRPDPFRKLSHVEVDLENKLGRTLQRDPTLAR